VAGPTEPQAEPQAELQPLKPRPAPSWLTRRRERALVILLLLGQVLFYAAVAARQSPAGDERTHYLYAHRILFEGSFFRDDEAMFNSKMPVQVVNVLPQYLAERVKLWPFTLIPKAHGPVREKAPHLAYLFWARLAGICLVPGFALVFYLWARRLYGPLPGLILLALLALCPNLAAVWSLILADGQLAAAFLAALFFCSRYAARPSPGRLVAAGFFLGLAQLVKNTAVILALIVPLAWLLQAWPDIWDELKRGWYRSLAGRGVRALGVLGLWLVIGLIVLNTGFGWQGVGHTLARIEPISAPLRSLPPAIQNLPLPLPEEFVNGLDQVIFDDQNSMTIGLVYLDGLARHMGWSGYYFLGLLWKLPLGLLGLVGLALILRWRRVTTPDDAWLVVPVVAVLLRLSFTQTVQLGVKYVLVIVPFLLLFAGRALAYRPSKWAFPHKIVVAGLCLWIAVSSLGHFPDYLSYFNELTAPGETYLRLAAYDLSAGQGSARAERWAKSQTPPMAPDPAPLRPGRSLVSGGALLALHGEDRWRVLRESYRPVRTVAGEYFLFQAENVEPRQWTLKPGSGRDR